jgi:hypothetical protein
LTVSFTYCILVAQSIKSRTRLNIRFGIESAANFPSNFTERVRRGSEK